ncbi:MAG: M48 family metallopeptidase [Clostridiales bacterium]|nr:M48 family metallopeptidase [Clostridiales bacterium]
MKYEIVLGELVVKVEKKRIKNMYIKLKENGDILVTAPLMATSYQIEEMLMLKKEWIKKHRKNSVPKEFITGENIQVWGKTYTLIVEEALKNEVILENNNLLLRVKDLSRREEVLNNWYREILKKRLVVVSKSCEMNLGIRASEWRIKNMKTKWGSCNTSKKRIWINLQMAKKPPECLEYLVTHELTHLYEHSHNYRFKALMDGYYPNWRMVRKILNEKIEI